MLNIDLAGRIVVITGATGQLGRVITRTLALAGADVVICYLNSADKAMELVSECCAMGVRALAVQADVTQQESVFALRDAVKGGLGDADVIVNNAVIQYNWTTVLEQPLEDFESQFRSCVLHNVLMAKAFVPGMVSKNWGRIIAINTECTVQASTGTGAYVSGKAGQDRVLRVLAKEVGPHQITVNQVAPGWMISDRNRADGSEVQPEYAKNVPLRRRGTDQDIANTVAYLASEQAGFISGAFIPVSGGTAMPAI